MTLLSELVSRLDINSLATRHINTKNKKEKEKGKAIFRILCVRLFFIYYEMSPSGSCFECLIPSWWNYFGRLEKPAMWGLTERTGSLGIDSWWYIIPDHFRSLCFLPNMKEDVRMKTSPRQPSLVTHANPRT